MDSKIIMENISIKAMDELKIEYDVTYKIILNYSKVQEWMKFYYMKYNTLFFDNDLPPLDRILLIPIIKYVGYLGVSYSCKNNFNIPSEKDPYILKLNFAWDMIETEWQNVLLHEMIHIWQYTMGYSGGHGKSFKMKAKEINEIGGWGITTKYKTILEDIKYAKDERKYN